MTPKLFKFHLNRDPIRDTRPFEERRLFTHIYGWARNELNYSFGMLKHMSLEDTQGMLSRYTIEKGE